MLYLYLWLSCVCFVQSSGMLSYVERYEVVRPQRLQDRQRRSLQGDQLYPEMLRFKLAIEGRNHTIRLGKNRNLLGKDFTETNYTKDGTRVTTSLNEDHCYYHGHIEGMIESSASVGICSGMSGFVRARRQVYLIEPLGESLDGDHAVYRREHLKMSGSATVYDRDQDQNQNQNQNQEQDQDQGPRAAGLFRSWKTEPVAGPQKFVEMFVVVDNTEYKRYGTETKSRILEAINHVDKLYRPLNIRVMLVGLEVWTDRDHIDVVTKSERTLDNFLLWRQTDLLQRTKHDNAQFVTGKKFETDTVGLANKYAMCTGNSGAVNQDHHQNLMGLASTIAHEMGHNFGMSHDAAGCECRSSYGSDNCIMTEKLRTGAQASFPELFSSCSVAQLAEFMERAQPSCLHKPGADRTIGAGPLCGNGLLDPGEECDCGTVEECKNPCCDASTCRLTEGSVCAHGHCCEACQLKAAESVCRPAAGPCDLPEHCTGRSGNCPDDSFQMNGKACFNKAQGFCHNGQCPTLEHHCWRLFGAGARVGAPQCFDLNKLGDNGTNCGRRDNGYVPCAPRNLRCGTMFCEGGGESITGKLTTYTMSRTECRVAVDDDGSRNINMVPEGTVCGPNKVCLGHSCVDTRVYGTREDCEKKCNNNGVCNHKYECHCLPGWAPPHCDIKYADLPQGRSGVIAGVCAVVSFLLVLGVLAVGFMCFKHKKNNYVTKRHRKAHWAAGKLNPVFQDPGVKERPHISQPTFMESTATQICAPLRVGASPSRPAPQPPKEPSHVPPSDTEPMKPQPPAKPLPPLNKPQHNAAKPNPPPVPPVKPSPPPVPRLKPCIPPLPPAKPQIHTLK